MGTDVEATCAPPSHLPFAPVASSPEPTADNWNCDQSHRIEHSDLTFDYCVARNDLHQRHRPVRSYSWTRPPAPLLPRSTRVEHMPHRLMVEDTDAGERFRRRIEELEELLSLYRQGVFGET